MVNKSVKKLTPYKDGKKRKMVMTKLTAVALTARGANPAASVTFFKTDKSAVSVEKRTVLASIESMHAHAIVIDDYAKLNKGGSTSWAGSDSSNQHSHDFVIEEDGTVTIGANEGHLHIIESTVDQITKTGLSDEQVTASGLVLDFRKTKPTADTGGQLSGNEDNTMTDEQKAAKKAADDLALVKSQLALAILLGSMNDAQKAFHDKLDDDKKKKKFLEKSVEDREAIVTAAAKTAADDNAEIYKSKDGIVFTKSDDPRLVAMAKSNDILAAQLAKSAELTADQGVAKRATELFKNLSGDASAQTALLKSVDSIENEDTRKSVMEILAKSDAGIADVLKEHGSSTVVAKAGSADEANGKLEALAKKYVEDNPGTNAFDAYGKVADANPALYTQAVG